MEVLVFGGSGTAEDCWTDYLGRTSNARRSEDPLDDGVSVVPVGFGSLKNPNHPVNDPMGDSADFGMLKGVKWQIPLFDGKTTWWRRFEMEFLMAM